MPIQDKMMRGGTTIRNIIAAHLAAKIPPAIDIMLAQNSELNSLTLAYPNKYDCMDPEETDVYPFVGAFVTDSDNWIRIGNEPSGALEYEPKYQTTIFVTTRTARLGLDGAGIPKWETPERGSAMRQRDDLMAILANVILNEPSLGTAGSRYRAMVDEDSIRMSYPQPFSKSKGANPAWVCSGLISVRISLIETTVVPYIGHVETIDGILNLLPKGE